MRLEPGDLQRYWDAAAEPVPAIVLGAGRWGKVWSDVLGKARGSAAGIILVARSNFAETDAWARAEAGRPRVVSSLAEAFDVRPGAEVVIVASRPRDHMADASSALAMGAHVLVEKPLSDDPAAAQAFLESAARFDRTVAIGTEFAFLPAFHQACAALEKPQGGRLVWDDPVAEVRYGDVKIRHDEIGVLSDLFPHAVSIFRVVRPAGHFSVAAAGWQDSDGVGSFSLEDDEGGTWEFQCNIKAPQRHRCLEAWNESSRVAVDFTAGTPKITVNDAVVPTLQPELQSTLRLELGCFLDHVRHGGETPITSSLHDLARLEQQLLARLGDALG